MPMTSKLAEMSRKTPYKTLKKKIKSLLKDQTKNPRLVKKLKARQRKMTIKSKMAPKECLKRRMLTMIIKKPRMSKRMRRKKLRKRKRLNVRKTVKKRNVLKLKDLKITNPILTQAPIIRLKTSEIQILSMIN